MRTVSILGSTGSIGKQALEVIDGLPGEFNIFGLAAGKNIELLKHQINKYKPEVVSVETEELAQSLSRELKKTEVFWGQEGLKLIAGNSSNETVLISVTGINGLEPTISALQNGINVALANKETLVASGKIVTELAKKKNSKIIPVDSEHSAIYQCLTGKENLGINKIILTASGGPFRTSSPDIMQNADIKTTLAHPRWSMGEKITVDSATLMNKGLEVIEAHWLFSVDYEKIQVVIHPQSLVHGAVEFADGSVISQMGIPSMHIPVQYALTHPKVMPGIKTGSLDLTQVSALEFEKPDFKKFPCLKLAYEAGKQGGTYPAALNAANEEAVYAFLKGKIKLTDIPFIVEKALDNHNGVQEYSIQDILKADAYSRDFTSQYLMSAL